MEHRLLSDTGLNLPVVGMGTWRTFDVIYPEEIEQRRTVVDAALEGGCNLFDSSPMYGNAERVLSEALKGRRDQAIIATKVWTADDDEAAEQVRRAFDYFGERPTLRHELAMAPTLYALCGLPFAGKSTVAAELASEVGAPIVRLDAVNAERGWGLNAEPIPADEWDRTYAEAYRRLDQTLAAGSSVIFDHVNFTRAERDRLRQIAAKRGARVQIVYVPVTVDEARRRMLANRETGARHDVRDDDFEHVVAHFEPPDDEPDVMRRQARQ